MSSPETLAVPVSEPAHIRLMFTPDNMRNTTVTLGDSGKTLYSIRSAKDYSSTTVADAEGTEVGKIKYRSVLPDTIKLHGTEKKLKEWLPDRKSFPVTMNASDGKQYVYKADPQRRVALYSADNLQNPIAWYNRRTDDYNAHLALAAAAEGIRDEVVCAFLILRAGIAASHAAAVNAASVAKVESTIAQIDLGGGAPAVHMPVYR